jgi:hypothetical protein
MKQPCKMYFFMKTRLKQPPQAHMMKTVIFKVANIDSTDAKSKGPEQKLLKAGVTQALKVIGAMSWMLDVEVFYLEDPKATEADALEMLHDDTWSWKDDAVTLSLHCLTVEMDKPSTSDLYCESKP